MSGLCDDGENVALDYLLGLVTEVRLMSANGSDSTPGVEVVGGTYAPATGATWTTAVDGSSSNAAEITFGTLPAGSVVGVELWDAATPRRLWWGALGSAKTFLAGDPASFAVGTLVVSID